MYMCVYIHLYIFMLCSVPYVFLILVYFKVRRFIKDSTSRSLVSCYRIQKIQIISSHILYDFICFENILPLATSSEFSGHQLSVSERILTRNTT